MGRWSRPIGGTLIRHFPPVSVPSVMKPECVLWECRERERNETGFRAMGDFSAHSCGTVNKDDGKLG